MTHDELRLVIRRRISAGCIPPAQPGIRIFGGKSAGATCDCCDRAIAPNHMQYDVEFGDGRGRVIRTLSMHLDCHNVWVAESREVTIVAAASPKQDERESATDAR